MSRHRSSPGFLGSKAALAVGNDNAEMRGVWGGRTAGRGRRGRRGRGTTLLNADVGGVEQVLAASWRKRIITWMRPVRGWDKMPAPALMGILENENERLRIRTTPGCRPEGGASGQALVRRRGSCVVLGVV